MRLIRCGVVALFAVTDISRAAHASNVPHPTVSARPDARRPQVHFPPGGAAESMAEELTGSGD